MRARTLAGTLVLAAALAPGVACADPVDMAFDSVGWLDMPAIDVEGYGGYQSAVHAGNTARLRVVVRSGYAGVPNATVDLSALGLPATSTALSPGGYDSTYARSKYYADFAVAVATDTPEGSFAIPITVATSSDPGDMVIATTTELIVDDTPPLVSLAALSVPVERPQSGFAFTLSGKIADTGSVPTAVLLYEDLLDASGQVMPVPWSGPKPLHSYAVTPLPQIRDALASSTDGSFSVKLDLNNFDDRLHMADVATLRTTLYVADQAGNVSSSTISQALPPPPQALDSVLFIPGTETSRLYYRDGFGIEHEVWEPTTNSEVGKLALNPDGTSKYDVYTKPGDIIGHFYDNRGIWGLVTGVGSAWAPQNLEVYDGLSHYLDGLVASSTLSMHEWRSYPYDWRLGVRDLVDSGTKTLQSDGSFKQVFLEDVVEEMASSSATGKVAIVAHSNGGLIAKALMEKLVADGRGDLVDKLIMVGSPQWGTPTDLGVMLHGDGQEAGLGLVISSATARTVSREFPDAYDLLPSPAYFAHVADPVATFDSTGTTSAPFASAYGWSVLSSDALASFVKDVASLVPALGDTSLRAPLPLRDDLLASATADHADLDTWTPPAGLSVTAIAGWGQPTTSGLAYTNATESACLHIDLAELSCTYTDVLRHAPILTQDGDGTVVTPSALGDTTAAYYFDASAYKADYKLGYSHQFLTSAPPVESFISSILLSDRGTSSYILRNKPTKGANPLFVISTHSPLNLSVTDADGNISGVVPIPGTDFSGTISNIPGSSVFTMDDENYVYLPDSGTYSVAATGYGSGPAAIELGTTTDSGASITTTQAFTDIPVKNGTALTLSVDASAATSSALSIDENGNGSVDATVQATGGTDAYEPPAPSAPVSVPAEPTGGGAGWGPGGPPAWLRNALGLAPPESPPVAEASAPATAASDTAVQQDPTAPPATTTLVVPVASATPAATAVPPTAPAVAVPSATSTPASTPIMAATGTPVGIGTREPGPIRIEPVSVHPSSGTATAPAVSQTAAALNATGSIPGFWASAAQLIGLLAWPVHAILNVIHSL